MDHHDLVVFACGFVFSSLARSAPLWWWRWRYTQSEKKQQKIVDACAHAESVETPFTDWRGVEFVSVTCPDCNGMRINGAWSPNLAARAVR